jgi:uncharacterized protein YfkK (UPF0435 family)
MQWDELQELIQEGIVTHEEIKSIINQELGETKKGIKKDRLISFEQFQQLVEAIFPHLDDHDEEDEDEEDEDEEEEDEDDDDYEEVTRGESYSPEELQAVYDSLRGKVS